MTMFIKKKLVRIFTLLFALNSLIFASALSRAQCIDRNLGIIPAPLSVTVLEGSFEVRPDDKVAIVSLTTSAEKEAYLFSDYLKYTYGLEIPVKNKKTKSYKKVIYFSTDYTGSNPEGYHLTVKESRIDIVGKGAGLFYGLQSLMQMCSAASPDKKKSGYPVLKFQISHDMLIGALCKM